MKKWRFYSLSGEVLGALCRIKGPSVYLHCRDEIMSGISDNLERNIQDGPTPFTEELQKKLLSEKEGIKETEAVSKRSSIILNDIIICFTNEVVIISKPRVEKINIHTILLMTILYAILHIAILKCS